MALLRLFCVMQMLDGLLMSGGERRWRRPGDRNITDREFVI